MSAEIILFNRMPETWAREFSFEWWCGRNGRDCFKTSATNEADYRDWAASLGREPFWEIPF